MPHTSSQTRAPRVEKSRKAHQRVRVERGIYRNPATGKLEFWFKDSNNRGRFQTVDGGIRDARKARAKITSEVESGKKHVPTRETVEDYSGACMARQTHLRPRTMEVYETNLRLHVIPHIGRRKITEVDVPVVKTLIATLQRKGLKAWTIRGVLTVLSLVLADAAEAGKISANPVASLKRGHRPKIEHREMRTLKPGEIERLLSATAQRYFMIIITAIFTGLRQGELLGLRWLDVNFADELIHVRHQLDRSGELAPLKTENGAREVALMPALAVRLREHQKAALARGFARPTDYVFTTEVGTPFYWRNVSARGLAKAVERAGLNTEGERNLRFHDLRHTFAAILIEQGHDDLFVSRQLGHASPMFTKTQYGHLFDRVGRMRHMRDAMQGQFGSMLESARASSPGDTRRKKVVSLAG